MLPRATENGEEKEENSERTLRLNKHGTYYQEEVGMATI